MKGAVLTWERRNGRRPGTIGSSVLRGIWLKENWPDLDVWKEGHAYDFVIFQKVYWKEYLEAYKGIKILDMCDPDWMKEDFPLKLASLSMDAITVSSKALKEFVEKVVDIPVIEIPDRVHPQLLRTKEHYGRAERVVWYGYSHNARVVLPSILPALAKRNLKLLVVSDSPFDTVNNFGVEIENRVYSWDTMPYDLQYGDMVLNPQNYGGRFKYKSDNKTFIAWGMGLPVVKSIEDLDRFMDPMERRAEVDLRQAEVKEKWLIPASVEQYKSLINDLCQKKQKS